MIMLILSFSNQAYMNVMICNPGLNLKTQKANIKCSKTFLCIDNVKIY